MMQQRREERESVLHGKITIAGQEYPLANWSSMGFLAEKYEGDIKIGDRIDITISLKTQSEKDFHFSCQAIITRNDAPSQTIAGSFVRISAEIRKKISDHFTKKDSVLSKIKNFIFLKKRNNSPQKDLV